MEIKELKSTAFCNYKYIIDVHDNIVGIIADPGKYARFYMLYDRVRIVPDSHGSICPGIKTPTDYACIIEIVEDSNDHWFRVLCPNGEEGICKPERIKVLETSGRKALIAAGLTTH